jgi:hypothetical protein
MIGWIVKPTARSGWRAMRFTLRVASTHVSDSS